MSKEDKDRYFILRLLSDAQRVEILRELKRKDQISFSDLWRSTGLQSGRLAFQLKRLMPLLRKTKEDHYALNETGLKSLEVLDYYESILAIEEPGTYEASDGRPITIREAKPEDYRFIVEADCSWVEKWLKPLGKKRVEAAYEELAPWERIWEGGPWRDLSAYKAYARFFLKEGGKIFVPEVDGKVVGFMEVILNEEPEPFGKFIDTGNTGQTEVHKDFCGLGVGTALLEHLTKTARRLGYEAVDFGGSEYETDEFNHFLAKSNLKNFNFRAISIKTSEIERDGRGKLDDLSKTSLLKDLLTRRPLTWKIQPVKYILWIQKGILDTWRDVQGILKAKESGLRAFQLEDKVASIYLRAPDPEVANMFVWVSKENETDTEFLREVLGACGKLAREMKIGELKGYISDKHREMFQQLGFEIGKKGPYTRILL